MYKTILEDNTMLLALLHQKSKKYKSLVIVFLGHSVSPHFRLRFFCLPQTLFSFSHSHTRGEFISFRAKQLNEFSFVFGGISVWGCRKVHFRLGGKRQTVSIAVHRDVREPGPARSSKKAQALVIFPPHFLLFFTSCHLCANVSFNLTSRSL